MAHSVRRLPQFRVDNLPLQHLDARFNSSIFLQEPYLHVSSSHSYVCAVNSVFDARHYLVAMINVQEARSPAWISTRFARNVKNTRATATKTSYKLGERSGCTKTIVACFVSTDYLLFQSPMHKHIFPNCAAALFHAQVHSRCRFQCISQKFMSWSSKLHRPNRD